MLISYPLYLILLQDHVFHLHLSILKPLSHLHDLLTPHLVFDIFIIVTFLSSFLQAIPIERMCILDNRQLVETMNVEQLPYLVTPTKVSIIPISIDSQVFLWNTLSSSKLTLQKYIRIQFPQNQDLLYMKYTFQNTKP